MHVCSFAHHDTALEADVREYLEDRIYRFFVGSDSESRRTSDDDRDSLSPSDISTYSRGINKVVDTTEEARSVVATLERIRNTAAVEMYTLGNSTLAERAAHDAVSWCANQIAQARQLEEYHSLDPILESAPAESMSIAESAARLRSILDRIEVTDELEFLRGRLTDLQSTSTEDEAMVRHTHRSIVRAIRAELTRIVSKRKRGILASTFSRSFPFFVSELNELLPKLASVKRNLEDFFGTSDALWDRRIRDWESVHWEPLESLSRELQKEESLQRLAQFLGRSSKGPAALRNQETRVPVTQTERETVAVGRSEIEGIETGRDLERAVPQELSLLINEETAPLFDKRFADGDLVVRSYKTREEISSTVVKWRECREGAPSQEGPIVVCVDTSGSMAGEPERVAKVTTLALTRSAVAEGRDCYLVFFSTDITCIEVTDIGRSIDPLVSYLEGSVRGGTDVAPALRKAIEVLSTGTYRNADVLVISDFRIPKIPGELRRRVRQQQDESGNRFHSLTITDKPVYDPLFMFDYRWHYNTSNPLSRGIPPEAFRLL